MLFDDRARGTVEVVELARLDVRLGLTSVLLLRERKPGLAWFVGALRCCGRAGDASRDDSGDDGEPERWRER